MSKTIQTPGGESYHVVQRTSEDGKHTYEEIVPVNDLASKTGITKKTQISEEVLKRAEAVAASFSLQYTELAHAEIERLREMTKALSAANNGDSKQKETDAIFFTAHDLKGQGGSFDYPIITHVATSLCRLIKQAMAFDAQIIAAIEVHINALALVMNKGIKEPLHPDDKRLIAEVEALTLHLVGPATDE